MVANTFTDWRKSLLLQKCDDATDPLPLPFPEIEILSHPTALGVLRGFDLKVRYLERFLIRPPVTTPFSGDAYLPPQRPRISELVYHPVLLLGLT
ncbi:hypothetical protein CEXT_476941 [Caerostris extrusa]|uniref:Uncharacterized protein n=1 Tax=Caerostris extrusa TaxID=172846 RepID=A0AAV4X5R5_CAEEX|nr:hypothetical protein CEXT_476941 [Caerostris extrusa]